MEPDGLLAIEVVYALRDRQVVVSLAVIPGTTMREAIHRAGLVFRYGEIDSGTLRIGIFGHETSGETILREGDRVEIYRPLIADPKRARRRRAARER